MSDLSAMPEPATQNLIDAISIALWIQRSSALTFAFGMQAGLTLTLLLVLVLLTRPAKRATAVFRLNIAALTCATIRLICQTVYFFTPASLVIVLQTYGSLDAQPEASQFAAGVFAMVQSCCVMASLFLQVKAVSAPMAVAWKRRTVVGVAAVMALATAASTSLFTVLSLVWIVGAPQRWANQYLTVWWMIMVWINQAAVCFFSVVFVAKLAVVIMQRRKIGIKQFGPMEIIFIMGCQTTVVPAILTVIAPYVPRVSSFSSLPMILTTILLPFSAIWAAETLPEEDTSGQGCPTSVVRAKLFGSRSSRHGETPAASRRPTPSLSSSTIISWKRKKSSGTDVSVDEVQEAGSSAV